jgi:hypothetical protein
MLLAEVGRNQRDIYRTEIVIELRRGWGMMRHSQAFHPRNQHPGHLFGAM